MVEQRVEDMQVGYIEFHAGEVKRDGPKPPETFKANISITDAHVEGDTLTVSFEYTVGYAPGSSGMRLLGKASFMGKDAEKAQKEWAKSKTIEGPAGEYVINALYYHSTINAIQIARQFGLTAPVVFPQMKFAEKKK